MSNVKRYLYISLLFICMAVTAFADINVTAEVNSREIALGGWAQFTINVNGTQNAEPANFTIEGFDVKYIGPSRRISMVNGVTESSIGFTYSLLPLKTGDFQIPSIEIEAEGNKYTTQPIPIKVVDSQTQPTATDTPSQTTTLEDKIFITVSVPQKKFYSHEPIPVNIILYVRDLQMREIQMPQITADSFEIGEFSQPSQSQKVIQGVRFDVLEFNTVIYPLKLGELTLGPISVGANIITQSQRQTSGDPFNRFFDDDFFGGMFQRLERHPVTITANPLKITVNDLPQEGKPVGFSGAVGKFELETTVSPKEVKAGDPVTVRMVLKGKGNLDLAELPVFKETQQMRVYKPQIKQENGTRVSEQVLIPTTEKLTEIPAIEFSYFDSETTEYRTLRNGPFPITVAKPERGEDLKVVNPSGKTVRLPAREEKFGEDIIFIKDDTGKLYPAGYSVFRNLFLYFALILIMGGWVISVIRWRIRSRLATDESYAGKTMAPKYARKGLGRAKQFAAAGQKPEFYDAVFKTLQQYLTHKYRIPPGSVNMDVIQNKIPKMKPEIRENLRSIFQECEIVRYAAASLTNEQMQRTYINLEQVIDNLERTGK